MLCDDLVRVWNKVVAIMTLHSMEIECYHTNDNEMLIAAMYGPWLPKRVACELFHGGKTIIHMFVVLREN